MSTSRQDNSYHVITANEVDEIMVTLFDTGETPATVTIKVTNLVTDADSSYQVTRNTDARPNCDWFASSEGGTSFGTRVTPCVLATPLRN